MFGRIVLVILIAIVSIGMLSIIMTAIKLGIFKAFDFMIEKALWLEYCIYFAVMLLIFGGILLINSNYEMIVLIRNIVIIVGTGTIFEFIYFYKKHFDFESKGKYFISLVVSNVAVLIVSNLIFYFGVIIHHFSSLDLEEYNHR